ncbi:NADPH-dependent FMN reductase [Longimicrobium terrae]|uniref:NAD(P)H-dependent FMN reductase n=1 Tax=Longimicrobium terrae TaxID=1639882 RepID=A0A841H4R2_9BACT|nr:NAD(P)H-dependent oxidoreductase [Longimicrobium terrae]MBB4638714.1 NAD(P)H-dependent FMN reductase [Longimicrobium terrae]MBB6072953.1 NAD(P)H-dependent FMN reductase [Longimicrobium terrae]NNC31565.1 NAD(P)H-dependent oxidoreductase [Longimicrobium terrae]
MAADIRIAIIPGSTRDTRFGDKPTRWIQEIAAARGNMEVELVDLRDFDMPFFNEIASNMWVPTQNPEAVRWQKTVAQFDGYIFVTPEYNRSITGVLKNALDYAYPEWNRKAAACVGYGPTGATRAVEHLRLIAVELQMAPTRTGVHIQGADFMAALKGEKRVEELEYLRPNIDSILDELVWWTRTLKAGRDTAAAAS